MRKLKSRSEDLAYLAYRWISPVIDPVRFARALPGYVRYFRDWMEYSRLRSAETLRFANTYPCIHDRTVATAFDSHYFYQDIWAFRKIVESRAGAHLDIGSRIDFVGFLTVVCKVTFVDIRPLEAALDNFESKPGNILALPIPDNSVRSLSCLHVTEHIGLGRYGDQLDPEGTRKACRELSRVLAPNGNLYYSLPVGKPRLCFNAHRIHSPEQILEYFGDLRLVELSGIDDNGTFVKDIGRGALRESNYACGLFHFTKDSGGAFVAG